MHAPEGNTRRARAHEEPVDVIIPVYGGLEHTRACIESVLASTAVTEAEIVVIDDASPDPEIARYLHALGERVTLLGNASNLGFVATVNRGMALHRARDVVLLNSDTVVANDWLDRLRECAWRDADTGTVTPFSNNATICSYPGFCLDNPLPDGMSVAELDALFRDTNRGASVGIPTAVGFCMYIRRDCLEQVGLFDVALFGRGYGEENEFCLRAARRGWRHLLCADTFVYHAGGVSFADTQSEQKAAAMNTLIALYPDYESLIQRFVAADPPAPYRHAVDMARRRKKPEGDRETRHDADIFAPSARNFVPREEPQLLEVADANGRERYDAQPREPVPVSDEAPGATHPLPAARGARVPLPWKIRLKHWLQKLDG